jgi:uncharacterized protein (TIGR01777 family)
VAHRQPRRIIIAGGSGFIGRALASKLAERGDDVVILTRSPKPCSDARMREVQWDGGTIGAWAGEIDGAYAVINLAGKNVNCRYTRAALDEIDRSREQAVHGIADAIAQCALPPQVLVQASTTAIYGNAGDRWCDENAPLGEGIPVQTATKWESAFASAPTPDTRRVLLRISFVLGPGGGVMGTLSALTRCFLGGPAGSGRQYISWIHIDDLCRIILRAIDEPRMRGLYLATSPNPVTNAAFMRELRRVLHRPWSPPVPRWAVRFGCLLMRTEPVLALTGRRCAPRRLLEEGMAFQFTELSIALKDVISGNQSAPPSGR